MQGSSSSRLSTRAVWKPGACRPILRAEVDVMRRLSSLAMLMAAVTLLLPPRWCCALPGMPLACCMEQAPQLATSDNTCPHCRRTAENPAEKTTAPRLHRAAGDCFCQSAAPARLESAGRIVQPLGPALAGPAAVVPSALFSSVPALVIAECRPPANFQALLCCWRN